MTNSITVPDMQNFFGKHFIIKQSFVLKNGVNGYVLFAEQSCQSNAGISTIVRVRSGNPTD